MKYSHTYLVEIQYLGFRYSGWAKQPGLKTIHGFIDKTLGFVFGHSNFKTLGCSRTDSMVSAEQSYFQLFIHETIEGEAWLEKFNNNLPPDIKALSVKQVDASFNIIQSVKSKTYRYLFSDHAKNHPFLAPHVVNYPRSLDIVIMQEGARVFLGQHNFRNYCTELNPAKKTIKEITQCEIKPHNYYSICGNQVACWSFTIVGNGFLRHQIRLMMAQLIRLGKHEISLQDIHESLGNQRTSPFRTIAPASGLTLLTVIL
jgi:tRNA pseudouridine38-40 synthase